MPYYDSFVYNPRLRVSRAVSACSRCRQAKIKCNGNLPACDACEKAGRAEECSSANDQFAKGKERSFVASLEARIDKLEKRLEFARARKASVAMNLDVNDSTGLADRKDSFAIIHGAIRGNAAKRREDSDIDQLVSDFGFLFSNANTRDFESSSTSMTFARLILAASAMAPLPEASCTALPARSIVLETVSHYIDNVLVFYPAIADVTLLSAVENLYHENGQHASASEHWLVYMVLAIGNLCRSSSNEDDFYVAGVHWAARALAYSDQVLVPGHIVQIQALILFVQYAMLDPAHFDCWPLLGFAARSIVDIGLHQDPPYHQRPDQHIMELRRKVFYCVYSLDRSISMVHIRSFSFTDDSINVALPTASSTFYKTPVNPSVFITSHQIDTAIFLFQIRRLQSKWYQELFMSSREPLEDSSPYIWAMLQEIREWFNDLPEHLPGRIRKIFELEFLYSNIYCLAPSCRSAMTSELGKTLIFEYGTDFIAKMFETVRDPLSSVFLTYYDVLKVLFVARHVTAILDESEQNRDLLLNANRNHIVPSVEGETQLPPVPNHGRSDNIDRAINFIGQTAEIFDAYGKRWEDSKNIEMTFKRQVSSLLPLLCQRKERIERRQGQASG